MPKSESNSAKNTPQSHPRKVNKRVRLVCTFQAEGRSPDAELLEFLNSKPDGRLPKSLLLEAGHLHWAPLKLLVLKEAGQIDEVQFRRNGLLAITQQEAWLNYCRQLLSLDPAPQIVHHQHIYTTGSSGNFTPPITHENQAQSSVENASTPDSQIKPTQTNGSNPFKAGHQSQLIGDLLNGIDILDEE